jgi:hypothetical protein
LELHAFHPNFLLFCILVNQTYIKGTKPY